MTSLGRDLSIGCPNWPLANSVLYLRKDWTSNLVDYMTYGQKTKPGAGLSLEQGMDACRLIAEIPTWVGNLVKYTVSTIHTNEVEELVQGLKQLEKDNLCKVHLKLSNKLSALHLGQTSGSLSTTVKPFVPLTTSSATAMGIPPSGGTAPPLRGNTEVTWPLHTMDDDRFTTDATSPVKKKKNCQGS